VYFVFHLSLEKGSLDLRSECTLGKGIACQKPRICCSRKWDMNSISVATTYSLCNLGATWSLSLFIWSRGIIISMRSPDDEFYIGFPMQKHAVSLITWEVSLGALWPNSTYLGDQGIA
jgi:hypothetical protein